MLEQPVVLHLVARTDSYGCDLHAGLGLFSRVRLVRHKTLKTFFALKIMKKGEIMRRDQVSSLSG